MPLSEQCPYNFAHFLVTPGRKDNRMVKVGMEDTKGSRFAKTKQ